MHTQSHTIEAIAYDESQQRLRAKYRDSGETVVYENVPQELYDQLLFSDSIGAFFREKIDGRFPRR